MATPRQKLTTKEISKDHKGKHKVSEAQIAVHWKEEGYYRPPAKFIGQANLNDPDLVAMFEMVRRRKAQCLLQLRRSSSRKVQK